MWYSIVGRGAEVQIARYEEPARSLENPRFSADRAVSDRQAGKQTPEKPVNNASGSFGRGRSVEKPESIDNQSRRKETEKSHRDTRPVRETVPDVGRSAKGNL